MENLVIGLVRFFVFYHKSTVLVAVLFPGKPGRYKVYVLLQYVATKVGEGRCTSSHKFMQEMHKAKRNEASDLVFAFSTTVRLLYVPREAH